VQLLPVELDVALTYDGMVQSLEKWNDIIGA